MKRHTILREFIKRLEDDDVAIFTGKEMCKEAFQYDREGNFYITSMHSIAPAFAAGLANDTKKRVFIFSGEGTFLREIGAAIQMFVGQLRNLFYVILNDGCYQSAGGFPNIFNEMNNPKGLFFEVGFLVHDFSYFFKKKGFMKDMTNFMEDIKGPLVIITDVDKGLKRGLKEIDYSEPELMRRLHSFIQQDKE